MTLEKLSPSSLLSPPLPFTTLSGLSPHLAHAQLHTHLVRQVLTPLSPGQFLLSIRQLRRLPQGAFPALSFQAKSGTFTSSHWVQE